MNTASYKKALQDS